MKAKPKERGFDKPMQVRVSTHQLALFQQAAELDGRTMSNWARDRLAKCAADEIESSANKKKRDKS